MRLRDGLGRRIEISSTPPGGGSATITSYLWCGTDICQARDASNDVIRGYYVEGEYVPGSPAATYFYGPDQLGSVRRVFESTTNAPAFGYDPFGNALQTTTPLTDFGFAGMFYNSDSGLYLTQFRVYDPTTGRWLSRDPLGEGTGNLYAYAGNSPLVYRDRRGLWQLTMISGLGGGVLVTFGYNNGQWNLGGYYGVGEGISVEYDPGTAACHAPGLVTGIQGQGVVGLGPNIQVSSDVNIFGSSAEYLRSCARHSSAE